MLPIVLIALFFQPETADIRRLFEERYAREHTEQTARDLGLYLARHGDVAGARIVLTETLRLSGAPADALELALVSSASDAEPLLLNAAVDAKTAPRALDALGHLYDSTGNRAKAVDAYRKALAAVPRAVTLEALAQDVDPVDGIALLKRALAMNRRELGARHPQTGTTQANLAGLMLNAGQVAASIAAAREALSIFEETLGSAHPRTALACTILAFGLTAKGDRSGAERYYRRSLTIDRAAYGPQHPQTLKDEQTLADFLKHQSLQP